jgi:hypothetical protein
MTMATAGQSGTTTNTLSADSPFNVIQNLFLRDPYGQPIIQADGFSLNLILFYSGQRGMLGFGNDNGLNPSFVGPATVSGSSTNTAGGAGNFTFNIEIPLEADSSGYCSLASMNAASQPQVQIQLNPSATVYGATAPTALGTLTANINEPFWMAPVDNPQIAPPDVGSSMQWSVTRAQSLVSASAFQRIVLPRVGTFITTLVLILRDSTGARTESWPVSDLSLWVDGVPIFFEQLAERSDLMFQQFGAYSYASGGSVVVQKRPTGVVAYSWRESVQTAVSTADTYDLLLPTTPATLLEVAGTWGAAANSPYTLYCITGELFPVSGIPYTHLAQ